MYELDPHLLATHSIYMQQGRFELVTLVRHLNDPAEAHGACHL